jgi:hypothetical protein
MRTTQDWKKLLNQLNEEDCEHFNIGNFDTYFL